MTDFWLANAYSKFIDARSRPARDLLAAVPESFNPRVIYDLGCGPGNSTIMLKKRWPDAKIIGIDNSKDMLTAAKGAYPELHFYEEDINTFSPKEKQDCIFANASLQWIGNHEILFPRILNVISSGGLLAVQMPNNFHSAVHQAVIHVLRNNKWWQPYQEKLIFSELKEPLFNLTRYYNLLINSGAQQLQLWETEYVLEMANYEEILDWMKGAALRPVLSVMTAEEQEQFSADYIKTVSHILRKQQNNQILFPFKRIFIVVIKG